MNKRNISITSALIIINVVVFVLGLVVRKHGAFGLVLPGVDGTTSAFEIFCSYSWFTCFMEGELWRLLTYQFVHANFAHIFFNMWALFYFGPLVEQVMGPKRYLLFYLVCGMAGALFSSLLAGSGFYSRWGDAPQLVLQMNALAHYVGYQGFVHPWQMMPMVGASAAIYGVMVAVAFMVPHARVSLVFPPITITMRTLAISVIAIACAAIAFDWTNAGGEAGHLGGIIMGAAIMVVWRRIVITRHRNQDSGQV